MSPSGRASALRRFRESQVRRDRRGRFARKNGADPALDGVGRHRAAGPRQPPSLVQAQTAERRLRRHFGDRLHVRGMDDPIVRQHLVDLASLPESHLRRVNRWISAVDGGGIHIADEPRMSRVADRPDLLETAERMGLNLDDYAGLVVSGRFHLLLLTTTDANSASAAKHEFGHALDHALGEPSINLRYPIRRTVDRNRSRLGWYYAQEGHAGPREAFAEGYALWQTYRDADDRNERIGAGLGMPVDTPEGRAAATRLGRTFAEFFDTLG